MWKHPPFTHGLCSWQLELEHWSIQQLQLPCPSWGWASEYLGRQVGTYLGTYAAPSPPCLPPGQVHTQYQSANTAISLQQPCAPVLTFKYFDVFGANGFVRLLSLWLHLLLVPTSCLELLARLGRKAHTSAPASPRCGNSTGRIPGAVPYRTMSKRALVVYFV